METGSFAVAGTLDQRLLAKHLESTGLGSSEKPVVAVPSELLMPMHRPCLKISTQQVFTEARAGPHQRFTSDSLPRDGDPSRTAPVEAIVWQHSRQRYRKRVYCLTPLNVIDGACSQ